MRTMKLWLYILCELCIAGDEDTEALSLQSMAVVILFCAASFINGLGYAPVYSLGMAFIDNHSKNQKNSGSTIYLGMSLDLYTLYVSTVIIYM